MERRIPSTIAEEFIVDIFGRRAGCTYEEGLQLTSLISVIVSRPVWMSREAPYNREGQVSFFEYFSMDYADIVRHNVLKDL